MEEVLQVREITFVVYEGQTASNLCVDFIKILGVRSIVVRSVVSLASRHNQVLPDRHSYTQDATRFDQNTLLLSNDGHLP